jgi:hypothetical protein
VGVNKVTGEVPMWESRELQKLQSKHELKLRRSGHVQLLILCGKSTTKRGGSQKFTSISNISP